MLIVNSKSLELAVIGPEMGYRPGLASRTNRACSVIILLTPERLAYPTRIRAETSVDWLVKSSTCVSLGGRSV